jgi:hypothetical protein
MARRLLATLGVLFGIVVATPASAQESTRLDLSAAVTAATPTPSAVRAEQLPIRFESDLGRRGPSPLMTSLYASTAVMQALDVHSTMRALDRGAVEANPLMTGVTGNKAAFMALKAGVAVSTVVAASHMSKRNKVAAILTLVAINSAYAVVVHHNYRVAGR